MLILLLNLNTDFWRNSVFSKIVLFFNHHCLWVDHVLWCSLSHVIPKIIYCNSLNLQQLFELFCSQKNSRQANPNISIYKLSLVNILWKSIYTWARTHCLFSLSNYFYKQISNLPSIYMSSRVSTNNGIMSYVQQNWPFAQSCLQNSQMLHCNQLAFLRHLSQNIYRKTNYTTAYWLVADIFHIRLRLFIHCYACLLHRPDVHHAAFRSATVPKCI